MRGREFGRVWALAWLVAGVALTGSACSSSGSDGARAVGGSVGAAMAGNGNVGTSGSLGAGVGGAGNASAGNASAGTANAGTASAGASTAGGACAMGSIQFKLSAAADNPTQYCISKFENACSFSKWLTVRDSNDGKLQLEVGRCGGTCNPCQIQDCAIVCIDPVALPADGIAFTFDGSTYSNETCGSGSGCSQQHCTPPGNYTATICAYANDPTGKRTCDQLLLETHPCFEVPFTWPPATSGMVIERTLTGAAGSQAM